MAERVGKQTLEEKVLKKEGLVILDFYSDTCLACRRIAPLLAKTEEDHAGVYVGKVSINYEEELAKQYQITSAPTLVFLKNGTEQERTVGLVSKGQLEEIINKYL